MKFLHLSDLHLGKRVNGFSMLEDQAYILQEILDIADREAPDGVWIAGDIYDKPVPPAEAVQLFDRFLCRLAERGLTVIAVSGNHDSPERLSFGARLMELSGIHIAPVFGGRVEPVVCTDAWGEVWMYPLPFVKPAVVRHCCPEAQVETYTDALRTVIRQMRVDPTRRNVLIAHQFVAGAVRSESEEISVGGLDQVDVSVFEGFDYVALGHIHGPQSFGSVRYCGTPLKYSFSEAGHHKSVTVVELAGKGSVTVRTVPLTPLRDLREIRGSYLEVTAKSFYEGTPTGDYLHVTLTDEEDVPYAANKLRGIYPNLMRLDYDNARTRSGGSLQELTMPEERTPLELFAAFFRRQNERDMSDEQRQFMEAKIEEIWEGER